MEYGVPLLAGIAGFIIGYMLSGSPYVGLLWASGIFGILTALAVRPAAMCRRGTIVRCDVVLESRYSKLFNVPLQYYAALWFTLILALAPLGMALPLVIIGLAAVALLVVIEVAVLKALCIYCTALHIAIVTASITALMAY